MEKHGAVVRVLCPTMDRGKLDWSHFKSSFIARFG
jgi:hypothetical protein